MPSTNGEIILQGPHHPAQKSTRTGCSLCSTSWSKFASVTSTTKTLVPAMFLLADNPAYPVYRLSWDAEPAWKVACASSPTAERHRPFLSSPAAADDSRGLVPEN